MYRLLVFVASFLVSAALGALLFVNAPSIFILRANAAGVHTDPPKPLRVLLYNGPMPEEPSTPGRKAAGTLASRPGSVRDLVLEETQELPIAQPVSGLSAPPAPHETGTPGGGAESVEMSSVVAPSLAPRAEALARDHDLKRNDALLGGIESRLIAIPQDSARTNTEVARRLIPANDAQPLALSNVPALADGGGAPTALALPATVPATAAAPGAVTPVAPAAPRAEAPVISLLHPPGDRPSAPVPGLADETVIARKTLVDQVRVATPFAPMESLVRLEATTYVDPASRDGYFRLRIIPRDDAKIPPLPRDITFIIDASTSIIQRKLDLSVRGVAACLAMLRPEDRFNIVVFRDTPRLFRPAPIPAEAAAVSEARKFMEGLKSSGSTDVYGAVEPVLAQPPRAGSPGLVMVITDGRPTAGNREGRELIRSLSERNSAGNTVYTFGGGNTVNRYLMDLLAYRNRGESRVVDRIEDVGNELPKFFRRVQDAILVSLQADYGTVDESAVFPQALPDFYRGRVVTVYGRYRPGKDNDLVLRLQGRAGKDKKEIVLKADLVGAEKGAREIAEGWAFQKTYHLIGEITKAGETPEIMNEIRRLSNEFGVKTSYSP